MNLNDKVYFRMTPASREVVRKSIGKTTVYSDLDTDERGFSAWPLRSVMEVFGPCMRMEYHDEQVFSNNQILTKEEYSTLCEHLDFLKQIGSSTKGSTP